MSVWFGSLLIVALIGTSFAMFLMGARWQAVEQKAYGEEKRPLWFWVLSALLIGFYLFCLFGFISETKNWADWAIMVFIPVGWVIKGAAIIFNPKGRAAVSNLSGDQNWKKVALARLPIAAILAVLVWFAL